MTSILQRRARSRRDRSDGAAKNPAMVLAIIIGCYLMVVLDASVVITALPDIRTDLGFSSAGRLLDRHRPADAADRLRHGPRLHAAHPDRDRRRRPPRRGRRLGLVNVFQQVGSSLGIGLLVTVFAAASHGTGPQALTEGVPTTIEVSAGLIALALAISVVATLLALRRSPTGAAVPAR